MRKVAERIIKEELWLCEGSDDVEELLRRSKPLLGYEIKRSREGFAVILKRKLGR